MSTLSELLKEKMQLPIGNIYRKKVHGKYYYYYQSFENGERHYQIISYQKVRELEPLINRRITIEQQIKELLSKEKKVTLSNHAKRLTGQIMCGDIPVARFEEGIMFSYHERLAPLVIQRTHSLEKFLKLRTIDLSRTNARLLLKSLDIHIDEEYETPLYAYALSVGDNYWFKPKQSKLKYEDVAFKNDNYFDTALKGDTTIFPSKSRATPELTTTGGFEKGWKLIRGHWWLYKVGNQKQLFSELFCYEFAKLIGLKTAKYEYADGYIRSKNFAEKYNFEPLAALADSNDNYEHVFPILLNLDKDIAKQYLKMMMFDAVTYNIDRHNENIGLLRDKNTGDIICLAPNFDNNLALFSSIEIIKEPKKDGFLQSFVKFLKKSKEARKVYKSIRFRNITPKMIQECINNVPIKLDNINYLADIIDERYYYLKELFSK